MVESFVYEGLPIRVLFGKGTTSALGDEVRRLKASKVLVLTTPNQESAGHRLGEMLGPLFVGVHARATMHSPVEITEEALAVVTNGKVDCVVSFGGGSTIGLGKAIALRTGVDQLCIPTTYAGSEMTPILGETKGGLKSTTRSMAILPETVIYDIDWTMKLPKGLSATSGINAIAHAVEALYAKDRNPIISMMAEAGIKTLAEALPAIAEDLGDFEAHSKALYGAWLCGACLGAVGMALHHKLCHTLGGSFNLPHAETHAIILPHAVAYNEEAAPAAMAALRRALGADDPATALFALAGRLGAPHSLEAIGMPGDKIDWAADQAIANPYWNPRAIERDAIRDLIARAWRGDRPARHAA